MIVVQKWQELPSIACTVGSVDLFCLSLDGAGGVREEGGMGGGISLDPSAQKNYKQETAGRSLRVHSTRLASAVSVAERASQEGQQHRLNF